MKKSGDTAGHELAKGDEKEKQRKNAMEVLAKAKTQQASKKGKYVWNNAHKAYFFNPC